MSSAARLLCNDWISMRYFIDKRPQGFHHEFIYSDGDERKARLKERFPRQDANKPARRHNYQSCWTVILFPLIIILLILLACYIII